MKYLYIFILLTSLTFTDRLSSQTVVKEWQNLYNGSSPVWGSESFDKIIVDESNNIITAGTFGVYNDEARLAICKYSQSGTLLWKFIYSKYFAIMSLDLKSDNNGNIYSLGFDYSRKISILMKFNSTGDTLWSRNSSFFKVSAVNLIVDFQGNLILSGTSLGGSSTEGRFSLMKYDQNGNTLWSNSYDFGSGTRNERVYDMKADNDGNIFITGSSTTNISKALTMKVSSSGFLVWTMTYESPGNDCSGQKLIIDSAGFVYLIGKYNSTVQTSNVTILIIKYSNSGNQIWTKYYHPSDLTDLDPISTGVDISGNLYLGVNGKRSGNFYDINVLKYDPDGNLLWSYQHDLNNDDLITDLKLSSQNEIYFTGRIWVASHTYRCLTAKLNSQGGVIWSRVSAGTGTYFDQGNILGIGNGNNIFMAGHIYTAHNNLSNMDFILQKYDSSGNEYWKVTGNEMYNFSSEGANAIALDSNRNILLCGMTQIASAYYPVMIKYNGNGLKLWESNYEGNGGVFDGATCFAATDSEGSAYFVGHISDFVTGQDVSIAKFRSNGQLEFANVFRSREALISDIVRDIAIDKYNNLIITGFTKVSLLRNNSFVAKYDKSGNLVWKSLDSSALSNEFSSVSTDDSGNVYAGGVFGYALRVRKYGRSGETMFEIFESGGSGTQFFINDLAVDLNRNIYAAGYYQRWNPNPPPHTNSYYYFTTKFNHEGSRLWMNITNYSYYGAGAKKLAVDENQNVIVTGTQVLDWEGRTDIITQKFDSSGTSIWSLRFDGGINDYVTDYVNSITTDEFNNVYVSASSTSDSNSIDMMTIKYGPAGELWWVMPHNGSAHKDDVGYSILLDNENNIYASGISTELGASADFNIIKYHQNVVGIFANEELTPGRIQLYQNYPNPFNPKTIIKYELAVAKIVSLKVYDILGKEVATLVFEQQNAGSYSVEFDAANLPSGVYFYRLIAGEFIQTKKMIVVG